MTPADKKCWLFGRSEPGFVNLRQEDAFLAEQFWFMVEEYVDVERPPVDKKSFHYAPKDFLTIIQVVEGQLTLRCFGDDGSGKIALLSVVLNPGDYAIFYDFERTEDIGKQWEDGQPRGGHESETGPQGAILRRRSVPIDMLTVGARRWLKWLVA